MKKHPLLLGRPGFHLSIALSHWSQELQSTCQHQKMFCQTFLCLLCAPYWLRMHLMSLLCSLFQFCIIKIYVLGSASYIFVETMKSSVCVKFCTCIFLSSFAHILYVGTALFCYLHLKALRFNYMCWKQYKRSVWSVLQIICLNQLQCFTLKCRLQLAL